MNKNQYHLKVNDSKPVSLNLEDIEALDIFKTDNFKYHILHKNKSYKAEIIASDFNRKKYHIKVNNRPYAIEIADDLDLLIKDMGFSIAATKHINSIIAPMPGLVLDVMVKVGEHVKEHDTLLILEAMKMENTLISPRDGIIKSILAIKGKAVDKNELLIAFE